MWLSFLTYGRKESTLLWQWRHNFPCFSLSFHAWDVPSWGIVITHTFRVSVPEFLFIVFWFTVVLTTLPRSFSHSYLTFCVCACEGRVIFSQILHPPLWQCPFHSSIYCQQHVGAKTVRVLPVTACLLLLKALFIMHNEGRLVFSALLSEMAPDDAIWLKNWENKISPHGTIRGEPSYLA